tara:strand:- start:355 stop:528 length:174 start_codon:yes stop_codon:yes gene_type:complete
MPTDEKVSDKKGEPTVEHDESSDEEFDRVVKWMLQEKERVEPASLIWADPYRDRTEK